MDKLDAALMVMELREEVEKFRTAANVLCGAHIGVPQNLCPVCEVAALKNELRVALYLLRNGTIGVDEDATIATWAKLVGEGQ